MPIQVVNPRIRGFICASAHPAGCAANVREQVAVARELGGERKPGRSALILGSSTGYGLGTRIAAAHGWGMDTIGVSYERPPDGVRTGTAGWYNTAAFHQEAAAAGLGAVSINGDGFSNAARECVVDLLQRQGKQLNLVVYSLASPVRTHPDTGEVFRSALRPVGAPFVSKSLDLNSGQVVEVTVPPATEAEVSGTLAVMGGDDFERWVRTLWDARLLAPGAMALAYSYIGPQVTWPIYRSGTIGGAKEDLERRTRALDAELRGQLGGHAWVSVNKAVVTQASAAIPVVPLYISILYPVMQAAGTHERPIEQMVRLLRDRLGAPDGPALDEDGRIRLDDWEMKPDIQAEVARRWTEATTENLADLADFPGYQREFRRLFGFEVEGVDPAEPVETDVPIPGVITLPSGA